jgi:hypothetical protein
MKSSTARTTLGVSLLALCGMAFAASNSAGPVYNPSTEIHIAAVITGVRQVPDGPMPGVHLTVQSKTGTADVYLGPAEFLKIFKTNFPSGAPIQIVGSRVATASGEAILAREVTVAATTITLREFTGAPVWEHWGVVADSAVTGG